MAPTDVFNTAMHQDEDDSCCFNFSDKLNSKCQVMSVGMSLVKVVKVAAGEGRITRGFYECGKLLQTNPTNVMLCVLAENGDLSHDVAYNIHTTLMEAYCLENDIYMIKVDSACKLNNLLLSRQDSDLCHVTKDTACLLVEFSDSGEMTLAEEDVLTFCHMTSNICPQPIIELPK